MRVKHLTVGFVSALVVMTTGSDAADVRFSGTVSAPNACAIIVDRNGTLVQNSSGTVQSSRLTGGQSGLARVLSFWNYTISVDTPTFWDASPIVGDQDTTFQPYFSATPIIGGISFAQRQGSNGYTLPFGLTLTRVAIDLDATHQTSSFPTGSYRAEVVLRCE